MEVGDEPPKACSELPGNYQSILAAEMVREFEDNIHQYALTRLSGSNYAGNPVGVDLPALSCNYGNQTEEAFSS